MIVLIPEGIGSVTVNTTQLKTIVQLFSFI